MVGGGGSRKDESVVLNSTNVFAALGSLKKKKKSKSGKSGGGGQAEPEKEVYWAPAPLTVKSWADVDDEDDDDYFATTAPPELGWAGGESKEEKESEMEAEHVEVSDMLSDSEEEGVGDVDDDADEDHENELEVPVETETGKKLAEASPAPKDTERQLSKKELKKKGLEELDAVLAELGLGKNETSGQDESRDVAQEKKVENLNGNLDKKETSGESKSAKKKKKKDKSSKESRESQDQPDISGNAAAEGTTETEKVEDTSTGDVKERLKKVASMKKKKSSKEMDAAARAAASEAAARNARLASAKKKEKNHYNQQPVLKMMKLMKQSDNLGKLFQHLVDEEPKLSTIGVIGIHPGKFGFQELFECRVWVRVTQGEDILQHILTDFGLKSVKELRQFLQQKRYLVVLDNVWSTQESSIIVNVLPNGAPGSKMIITSRISNVVYCHDSKHIHDLSNGLSPEVAKNLFRMKVLGNNGGNLPFAISAVGGLLAKKPQTDIRWSVLPKII
ncbi:hypothetical protein ACLB2K_005230 [Fragaria x ananassa]